MKNIFEKIRTIGWWVGVPFIVGLFSYGPFLLLRCGMHPVAGESCWRLFSVGQLVFDLHAYLEFMGEIFSNAGGIHLQCVEWLIRGIRMLLPGASIVEMWLVLRWIFGVLTWWMLSWVLSFFVDRTLVQRRFAASVLWLGVFLPLGFRPGVFSWFMPFGLVMLVGCVQVRKFLQNQKILQAILWTLVAVSMSIVYSWFFIFSAIWMGVVWAMWFLSKWKAEVAWGIVTIISLIGVFCLDRFASDRISISFQTLFRNGMGLTRLVPVSVMLVIAILWFILSGILLLRVELEKEREAIWLMVIAWIVTITGWCSNVATGVYVHNDHFRIFILLFAWMSSFLFLTMESISTCTGWRRLYVWFVFLASISASLHILIRPYILDGDQLNIIHLFAWASLAMTAYHVLGYSFFRQYRYRWAVVFFVAFFIGFLPYVVMFQKEEKQLSDWRLYDQSMKWMQLKIPERDTICVDPAISENVAAFSGHSVFFTQQNIFPSGTDEDVYKRLSVLSSLTDASVSTTRSLWSTWLMARGTACEQYALYRRTVLSHVSQEVFDRITGCPRERMEAELHFVDGLSRLYGISNEFSKKACQWLVFPADASSRWDLREYGTAYQDKFIRIERVR